MIVLKTLSIVLCGTLVGFLVWGVYSIFIWVLINSFTIGFLKGSADFAEIIGPTLVVGVIHGTVIGIGVSLVAHRGAPDASFFYGFAATELALLIAQIAYAIFRFSEWTKPGYYEYILAIGAYFLLFSLLCLLPTIVICLVVSLATRSFYP